MRRVAYAALGLAVAVVLVMVIRDSTADPYTLQIRLANAGGLSRARRSSSAVSPSARSTWSSASAIRRSSR